MTRRTLIHHLTGHYPCQRLAMGQPTLPGPAGPEPMNGLYRMDFKRFQ